MQAMHSKVMFTLYHVCYKKKHLLYSNYDLKMDRELFSKKIIENHEVLIAQNIH